MVYPFSNLNKKLVRMSEVIGDLILWSIILSICAVGMYGLVKHEHYKKCPVANFPIIGRLYCDLHDHWKVDL